MLSPGMGKLRGMMHEIAIAWNAGTNRVLLNSADLSFDSEGSIDRQRRALTYKEKSDIGTDCLLEMRIGVPRVVLRIG